MIFSRKRPHHRFGWSIGTSAIVVEAGFDLYCRATIVLNWSRRILQTLKMIASLVVLLALIAYMAAATDYPTPGATFAAKDYTVWQHRKVQNSRRADVTVNFKAADGSDDYIHLFRLDMVGNPYERGFAHGALLTKGNRLVASK